MEGVGKCRVATLLALALAAAGCGRTAVRLRGEVYARGEGYSQAFAGGAVLDQVQRAGLSAERLGSVHVALYREGATEGAEDPWGRVPLGQAVTGPDGRYEIQLVAYPRPTDRYTLVFQKEGFQQVRRELGETLPERGAMDAVLVPSGAASDASFRELGALEALRASSRTWRPDQGRMAPLAVGNGSFLHGLIHVPPMESAWALPTNRFRLRVGQEVYAQAATGKGAPDNRFFASYQRVPLVLSVGMERDLEGSAYVHAARLDPDRDSGVNLLAPSGLPLTPDETPLGQRLAGGGAQLKWTVLARDARHAALALLGGVHMGLGGDEQLVSTGGADVHAALLFTQGLGRLALHLNAGLVRPGEQNETLVEDPRDRAALGLAQLRPRSPNPFAHGGLSAVWRLKAIEDLSLVAQVQGNTNAFREFGFLPHDPVVATGGARLRAFNLTLEGSLGAGLNPGSSDLVAALQAGFEF